MQKDPYLILGISRDATQEEINRAYYDLKSTYQDQIFEEGSVGYQATKKLAELESAYQDCLENCHRNTSFDSYNYGYGEIEELIRENKLEDAQNSLDKLLTRDAEWHFLQAVIYRKRKWNIECKKQLEIALALDGGNEKYIGALDRLNKALANEQVQTTMSQENQQQRGGYARPQNTGGANGLNTCCTMCNCLICTNCCCDCLGSGC